MKKILSVILALIMVISSTPAAVVHAEENSEPRTQQTAADGTELVSVTAEGHDAVVKWMASEAEGTFYQITYSQDKSFETGFGTVNVTGENVTSVTVSGLTNGVWYFRVRTCQTADGAESYSEWSSIKSVKIVPDPVEIISLTEIEGGIALNWTQAFPYSCGYQIRISKQPDFTPCETVSIPENYATAREIAWLDPLTEYYVKIRTYDTVNGALYYSGWSEAKSIMTGEDTPEAARRRNAEKIWAIGKLSGMTDAQCAGVLGNLTVESDIDPTAVEGIFTEPYQIGPRKTPLFDGNEITPAMESYTTGTLFAIYAANGLSINHPAYRFTDGRFCAGLGLIQFTGYLAQGLMKYARDNGKNWYDMDLQIAAVIGGNATTRRRFQQFLADDVNAGSVHGAAASWLGIMEMGIESSAFMGMAFNSRSEHAQEWYDMLSPDSFVITKRYRSLAMSAVKIADIEGLAETKD